MAWETRGGRRYYYRKVRLGKQVVSTYISDALGTATIVAEVERLEREARDLSRHVERREREAAALDESEFIDYFRLVETIAEAALLATGYHRHDRGRWRKRRMGEIVKGAGTAPKGPPATADEAKDLVKRARAGDQAAVPRLRELFDRNPDYYMAIGVGDVARCAREAQIRLIAKEDLVCREAMTRKLEQVEAELAGPAPSPIERLLAERASLCWFQVYTLDMIVPRDGSPLMTDQVDRLRDRANRRFLAALKTLANVRKLALPLIQVNVAGQQVNVAGDLVRP